MAPCASRTSRALRSPAPAKKSGGDSRRADKEETGGQGDGFVEPMKALGVTTVPAGSWRSEIKFDGYRALAVLHGGEVALWSRNHRSLAENYPEVVGALEGLCQRDAVLDGEIVALDGEGISRFQLLQQRELRGERPPIYYYIFDLLRLDGEWLLARPIEKRQRALKKFLAAAPDSLLRLSPVFTIEPSALLSEMRRWGLEGIVAKASRSPYEPGRRSGRWVKCRVTTAQEFVIGGFTPPRGGRTHFGALLIGYYDDHKLMYAGKVGSGFDHALLASLHKNFLPRAAGQCPFFNLPMARLSHGQAMTAAEMRKVTWLRPELVCEVRFAEWTEEGLLRQPVFLGLRVDKSPAEVVREIAPPPAGAERRDRKKISAAVSN